MKRKQALKKRGLTERDVKFRLQGGYTLAQAERRPGRHKARHMGEHGEWEDCWETRDKTGQLLKIEQI